MEPSPLTQQARPEVFQQKIVQLYDALFKDEDESDKSEGFWKEFFLLRPDKATLQKILNELSTDDLLHLQVRGREGKSKERAERGTWADGYRHKHDRCIKAGSNPTDAHALDTVTAFLSAVLAKKYTNPSSDIISVLAGLDRVDAIFTDFVAALDVTIRTGRNCERVTYEGRDTSADVSSGYTTKSDRSSIISDLWRIPNQSSFLLYPPGPFSFSYESMYSLPSDLTQAYIQDSDTTTFAFEPFTLLGLLVNYNKFEFQNPYRLRLEDFVNEATIQKIIRSVGNTCADARSKYIAIQDDIPEGWTIGSTLSMIGLGSIAPGGAKKTTTPVLDPEIAKEMFSKLPGSEAAVLLATYDFAHANKLFCFNLVSIPAEKGVEHPLSNYLSLTSYLLQHAHSSSRTGFYAHINLIVFRLLTEDQVLCKKICSEESKMAVRLCRQRQPFLPLVRADRIFAAHLLDVMIDGINHNLRRRLDVDLYILCVGIILRIISHLSRSRTRLTYHWSELFRSLLALVRFLTTYTSDLKTLLNIDILLDNLVNLIALSLSAGEAFLPSPVAYDDLFYKLVETGEVLVKFRDNYGLGKRPTSSIDTLISVTTHYNEMLTEGGKKKHLTSAQVSSVIKQGYETLSIQAKEGLDGWERYREVDERTFLKKVARMVVGDVRAFVGGVQGG
ncbi:UPF0588 membrane protein [Rutstroemia sp. NJR-2017a WRK4]|nr:UPF0588 membrane protein [Rutstroemia sp. NJR-2017a WRK4]